MRFVSFEDDAEFNANDQSGIGCILRPLDGPSGFDRRAERLLANVEYAPDLRADRDRAGATVSPVEGHVEIA